jgi:hypothetical protein
MATPSMSHVRVVILKPGDTASRLLDAVTNEIQAVSHRSGPDEHGRDVVNSVVPADSPDEARAKIERALENADEGWDHVLWLPPM